MDGLSGMVPYIMVDRDSPQLSFFETNDTQKLNLFGDEEEPQNETPARIYDWRKDRSLEYNSLRREQI